MYREFALSVGCYTVTVCTGTLITSEYKIILRQLTCQEKGVAHSTAHTSQKTFSDGGFESKSFVCWVSAEQMKLLVVVTSPTNQKVSFVYSKFPFVETYKDATKCC